MEIGKSHGEIMHEAGEAAAKARSQKAAGGMTFGARVNQFIREMKNAGKWFTKEDNEFLDRRRADKMRWINGGRDPI